VRRSAALAALVAVGVAACGARSASDARPAQGAASCPAAGRQTIEGGYYRMPANAQPGRTPVIVVVIPGNSGDRTDRLGVAKAGTAAGFAVVYPTKADDGLWTLNAQQGTKEVEDVTALLDRLAGTGCFDARRISITGVSNGAGFATRMACALPDRFAALVPVSAGYRALDPCPASARFSVLDIHGTADTVTPYLGKKPDFKGSVPRYLARIARRNGCSATPRSSSARRLVTRYVYPGCDAGLRVQALKLSGTDHGWPGAGPPLPEHNPSGLNSTTELLRFVRGVRRP
jgi:polyhydroxybutyrate depolymerase